MPHTEELHDGHPWAQHRATALTITPDEQIAMTDFHAPEPILADARKRLTTGCRETRALYHASL